MHWGLKEVKHQSAPQRNSAISAEKCDSESHLRGGSDLSRSEAWSSPLTSADPGRGGGTGGGGRGFKPEISISVSSICAQGGWGATAAIIGLDLHSQHQLGRLRACREIPTAASFHPHDKQGMTRGRGSGFTERQRDAHTHTRGSRNKRRKHDEVMKFCKRHGAIFKIWDLLFFVVTSLHFDWLNFPNSWLNVSPSSVKNPGRCGGGEDQLLLSEALRTGKTNRT